jgi:hypothetical protein
MPLKKYAVLTGNWQVGSIWEDAKAKGGAGRSALASRSRTRRPRPQIASTAWARKMLASVALRTLHREAKRQFQAAWEAWLAWADLQ